MGWVKMQAELSGHTNGHKKYPLRDGDRAGDTETRLHEKQRFVVEAIKLAIISSMIFGFFLGLFCYAPLMKFLVWIDG